MDDNDKGLILLQKIFEPTSVTNERRINEELKIIARKSTVKQKLLDYIDEAINDKDMIKLTALSRTTQVSRKIKSERIEPLLVMDKLMGDE